MCEKKLPWKGLIISLDKSWNIINQPTREQATSVMQMSKPQQDWFRGTYALYPEIKRVIIGLDKHNTEVRNELNMVYKELKGLMKKFKHVNRRI